MLNEAVYLLKRHTPEVLDTLRLQLPELGGELQAGILLGDGAVRDNLDRSRAWVAAAALKSGQSECLEAADRLGSSIRKAKGLAKIGQITAAVSSTSTLIALGLSEGGSAMVGAAMSLAGSLCSILGEASGGRKQNERTPQELFLAARELAFEARTLADELNLIAEDWSPSRASAARSLIKRGNDCCREITRIVASIHMK
jgi:hypothetical protein